MLTSNPAEADAPAILSGSAEDAITTLERHKNPLWYVAYGSNLASSVFTGRRRIRPLGEKHVLVEGLELTFDLPGLPYVEPRFANCRIASTSIANGGIGMNGDANEKSLLKQTPAVDLNAPWTGKGAIIGVAYLVSPGDFARVVKTEGGGSGYRMVSVEAKVFKSEAKSEEKERRFNFTEETVHAFTLLAPREKTRFPGQPSARYLSLIRKGAEEHNLPTSYRTYLASLTPYTARTFRQRLGAVVSIALLAPALIVMTLLGLALARKDGTYPYGLNKARDKLARWIWSTYDYCLRRVFGDGEGKFMKILADATEFAHK